MINIIIHENESFLPWDPIIFLWNQWLQKYIVSQLTIKCYFYIISPLLIFHYWWKFLLSAGPIKSPPLPGCQLSGGNWKRGCWGQYLLPPPLLNTKGRKKEEDKSRLYWSKTKHKPPLQGVSLGRQGGVGLDYYVAIYTEKGSQGRPPSEAVSGRTLTGISTVF